MGTVLFRWLRDLEYKKYPRYCGLRERRQLVCFLLTTLVELLYIPANLAGLNDYHHNEILHAYNWLHLAFAIVLQVAFYRNLVSTRAALYLFYIAIVLKLSAESLYQAFTYGLIFGHVTENLVIALFMAGAALACQLQRLCVIMCTMIGVDIAVCFYIGPIAYMLSESTMFFIGYVFILFVMLFNTKLLAKGLRQPHVVDAREKKAVEMLANLHEGEDEKANSLMNHLSEKTQERINDNLMESFKKKEIEAINLRIICQELTNSEIEICQLVLHGKSTTDICNILGKTRTNISSQRTHIRKKLGLKTSEDLRTALLIRLNLLD